MVEAPQVSIIVRTKDRSHFLREALQSVAEQSYPNIEVVVVNDGGEDVSPVTRAFEESIPQIQLIQLRDNVGRTPAANIGLKAAQGDFLGFLDDDDLLLPNHVEQLMTVIQKEEDLQVVFSDARLEKKDQNGDFQTIHILNSPFSRQRLQYENYIPIHCLLFSKQLLDKGCAFDESFNIFEDWDFWLQLSQYSDFHRVEGVSAVYRVHYEDTSDVNQGEKRFDDYATIFRKWGADYDVEQWISLLITARKSHTLAMELYGQIELKWQHLYKQRELDFKKEADGLRASLGEKDARLVENNANVLDVDNRFTEVTNQIAAMSQQLSNTSIELGQTKERLKHSHESLGNKQEELGHKQEQLTRNESDSNKTQLAFNAAQQKLIDTETHLRNINAMFEAHQRELLAVHASRLWRFSQVISPYWFPIKRVIAKSIDIIKHPSTLIYGFTVLKGAYRSNGYAGVVSRIRGFLLPRINESQGASTDIADSANEHSYQRWVELYDTPTPQKSLQAEQVLKGFAEQPLISIVMPVYNVDPQWLEKALDSVLAQVYQRWELCIADDASPNKALHRVLKNYAANDDRIKVTFRKENGHISKASNSALELATGEFVALMDQDDVLSPYALFFVVQTINQRPDAEIIYSDEDKIDQHERRYNHFMKPDFNYDLFLSYNMVCHFGVYRHNTIKAIGGFRSEYDGSQDYDLALRVMDYADNFNKIVHIPRILYHWRAIPGSAANTTGEKSYTFEAGRKVLVEHLKRKKTDAEVLESPYLPHVYRVKYALPKRPPLISIIIPTRNYLHLLKTCVDSIREKTTYPNYEVIVVDNDSDDPETLSWMDEMQKESWFQLVRYPGPFNFSAINNHAVKYAKGEYLLFLNNDTEVIHDDWLDELASHVIREEVGAVGARLLFPNRTLQHAGVIIGTGSIAGHTMLGLSEHDPGYAGRAQLQQSLSAVTGACLMIGKTDFEKVDGFNDTDFKVAFNDIDLSLKVRELGKSIVWTPHATLIHHESVSRGRDDDTLEKVKRFTKECERFNGRWHKWIKHDPAYNPNLSLETVHVQLSFPPRHSDYLRLEL